MIANRKQQQLQQSAQAKQQQPAIVLGSKSILELKTPNRSMMQNKSSLVITLVAISSVVALIMVAYVEAEHHEDHHKHHKFNPYKYGYKVIDHKGNKQWKQEESHSPMEVKGSYGYKDKHGMFREVSYIADKHGFRAHVKTNEPGTAPKSSAGVKMDAHPEPSFHKSHHGHEVSHGHH